MSPDLRATEALDRIHGAQRWLDHASAGDCGSDVAINQAANLLTQAAEWLIPRNPAQSRAIPPEV